MNIGALPNTNIMILLLMLQRRPSGYWPTPITQTQKTITNLYKLNLMMP